MQPIYLDHAAATPLDAEVFEAMRPYLSDKFYNPSALYGAARQVAADIRTARQTVAACLGARSSEIIFTAGGTEANNLAIHGVMARYPKANLIVSAIEHDAVLEPAKEYDHTIIAVTNDGTIDPEVVIAAINTSTVLVSIMYANNEIGTIEPIAKISQAIAQIRQIRKRSGNTLPLYLHTDACQAANYLDLHVARLGVDLLTLNGGKIYGPKQSGSLYIKSDVTITPLMTGGGQERNIRSGTENVANIIGFATALQKAQALRQAETVRLQKLQKLFIDQINQKLPNSVVNGSLKKRLPNNVHITFLGADNERMLVQLDEQGIMAAAGSACSASNDEPSHVLRAIGLDDASAQASLRFTMGRETTAQQIETVVSGLFSITKALY